MEAGEADDVELKRDNPGLQEHGYHHGDLKNALIRSGLILLQEGGIKNISLRKAAKLAGVSHAAPYRHFTDKNAMLASIAEEGFDLFIAAIECELEHGLEHGRTGYEARLADIASGYLKFSLEYPEYLKIMFGGYIERSENYSGLEAKEDRAFAIMENLIIAGQNAGEFVSDSSRLLALSAWSLIHGFSLLAAEQRVVPFAQADATLRLVVDMLCSGIATQPHLPE